MNINEARDRVREMIGERTWAFLTPEERERAAAELAAGAAGIVLRAPPEPTPGEVVSMLAGAA